MRILHLIDSTGPGGAETVFSQLIDALRNGPVESIVVLPRRRNDRVSSELGRTWLPERLRELGITPIISPTGGSFDVPHLTRLARLLRHERIDVLHAHQITAAVYGSTAGLAARVPVVCTFHGQNDFVERDRARRIKFGLINRGARHHVFVSGSLRSLAAERTTLAPARSRVVYNGVDVDAFEVGKRQEVRRELGVASDRFLVGAVGNMRPAKDYPTLVRAVSRLVDGGVDAVCVVIGEPDASILDHLRHLAGELDIQDRIQFLGFRNDVPRLLSTLDLAAISSSTEGFSLAAVQAMAAALPVVSTRCGGPEEILTDGRDGLLVPVGDPDALAGAMARLAENPEARRKMGEEALHTVRNRFSLRAMVKGYMELYSEAARGGAERPLQPVEEAKHGAR